MKIFEVLPAKAPRKPLSIALGVFDGVHCGHLAVLRAAHKKGLTAAALTFADAPERLLHPAHAPARLVHPDERLEQLAAAGLDAVWVLPFTRAFAKQSPQAFVELLRKRLNVVAVTVGEGFRFGHGAKGDAELLRRAGLQVTVVPALKIGATVVSSTRLRAAVAAGKLKEAQRLLGRPWHLRGQVVKGQGLGHQLGFPTANLVSPQEALPPLGVWAGRLRKVGSRGQRGPWKKFAANLGYRPTVDSGKRLALEFHLIGFKGSLMGATLEAEFQKHLRAEKRFDSVEALKAQISRDVSRAASLARI
jgi:riboflavin kinase/FMN adenylyltransferase